MRRFLIVLLVLALSGCSMLTNAENQAAVILDETIRKLATTSDGWQAIVEDTRDKLIAEGESVLANEVANALSQAVSDVAIEARCSADFLRDRVREELIRLKAKLTGEEVAYEPVFCNPTPPAINMNLPPDRRGIIEISGYNLTAQAVHVDLEDAEGVRASADQSLDNPTGYLVTVNVNTLALTAASRRLVFTLGLPGSTTVERTVAILPKTTPPKKEFVSATVSVSGWVDVNDDENVGGDENRRSTVKKKVVVTAAKGGAFHWKGCVGDEVQGYLDLALSLDKATGSVSATGNARYYEGDECGKTDLQGAREAVFTLAPGKKSVYSTQLRDGAGGVIFSLTFANESQKTVTTA